MSNRPRWQAPSRPTISILDSLPVELRDTTGSVSSRNVSPNPENQFKIAPQISVDDRTVLASALANCLLDTESSSPAIYAADIQSQSNRTSMSPRTSQSKRLSGDFAAAPASPEVCSFPSPKASGCDELPSLPVESEPDHHAMFPSFHARSSSLPSWALAADASAPLPLRSSWSQPEPHGEHDPVVPTWSFSQSLPASPAKALRAPRPLHAPDSPVVVNNSPAVVASADFQAFLQRTRATPPPVASRTSKPLSARPTHARAQSSSATCTPIQSSIPAPAPLTTSPPVSIPLPLPLPPNARFVSSPVVTTVNPKLRRPPSSVGASTPKTTM